MGDLPPLGQHVSVLGQTGCGKTYWVKNTLLKAYPRVIVVDTEEYDFNDWPRVSQKRAVALAASDRPFAVRVVAFPRENMDELNYGILERGHDVAVYYDEITDFGKPGSMDDGIVALARKARKRNISVIASTQRIQLLDKTVLANATHRIYFYCSGYDIEQVRAYAPFLRERISKVPYGSYRYLYQHPDGSITVEVSQ